MAITSLGWEIQYGMLPESLGPLIFIFTGAGNVSQVRLSMYNVCTACLFSGCIIVLIRNAVHESSAKPTAS